MRRSRVHVFRVPQAPSPSPKPRGTPEEQSLRRMRRYIATGLGLKIGQLPGFEASVLSLAVEAKIQRAEAKRLQREVSKFKKRDAVKAARKARVIALLDGYSKVGKK